MSARSTSLFVFCAALVACALACAPSFYDQYRAAHPQFSPRHMPRHGADLLEVVAFLEAPRRSPESGTGDSTTVNSVRVFDVTDAVWSELPLREVARVEFEPEQGRSYMVVAKLVCGVTVDDSYRWAEKRSWYVLPGNRLDGWSDAVFRRACEYDDRFVQSASASVNAFCIEGFIRKLVRRDLDLAEASCGPIG